jgi:hypothetical protein
MTRRSIWAFALVYTIVSIAVEMFLIIVVGLRVPQNNLVIAPVLLVVPPILSALICGYRRPKELVFMVVLTAVITFIVTQVFVRVTGVSTGFLEPIFNRSVSGFLSATIMNRFVVKKER